MKKIFVTEGDSRQALSVVRALGKAGFEITVGETDKFSISSFSKYCKDQVCYPDPKKYPDEFIKFILLFIKKNNIDLLFPVNDAATVLFSEHKKVLEIYTKVAAPPYNIIEKGRDKYLTYELLKNKFSEYLPETFLIKNIDDIKKLKNKLIFPVIMKPCKSSGSRGFFQADSYEELEKNFLVRSHKFDEYLLQEFIDKKGLSKDCFYILDNVQNILAKFASERIHMFPVKAGPMTHWRSIKNDELMDISYKMLKELQWEGIANLEFLISKKDGKPKLMEINPRVWGAIELSVASGANFPVVMYQYFTDQKVKNQIEYVVGKEAKWILPGEILYTIFAPNKIKNFLDLLKIDKKYAYSILSLDDPKPLLGILFKMFNIKIYYYLLFR